MSKKQVPCLYSFLWLFIKTLGEKIFINLFCPKHSKIINWNKNDLIFIFTLLCGAPERFHLFEAPKRSARIKNLCHFLPLLHWDDKGYDYVLLYSWLILFQFPLTIEIHKNNIDTFRVTNKQFYKIILF